MSLPSIARTVRPFSDVARKRLPQSPCSSPEKQAKINVRLNERPAIVRASSSTSAVPLPSSLAPGAAPCASKPRLLRESK